MKNKKVLLITLVGRQFNNNYGAVLQAYALQKITEKIGFLVQILDYNTVYEIRKEKDLSYYIKKLQDKRRILEFLKVVFFFFFRKIYSVIISYYDRKRDDEFFSFKKKYLNFTENSYYYFDSLKNDKQLKEIYDIYLVGSDQVWNPNFNSKNLLGVYLVRFINNVKKVSYASSVSAEIPAQLYDFYKESLIQFNKISVREKFSAEELEKILGFAPDVNLDPVFLLSREEWDFLLKEEEGLDIKDYIFIYDLYQSSEIIREVEKKTKEINKLYVSFKPKILFREYRYPHMIFNYYTKGPLGFLSLLRNSEFVITSSFHGVAFSLIFNKPFYVILWNNNKMLGQNMRILGLLDKLNLHNRYLINPQDLYKKNIENDIKWNEVNKEIIKMRNYSINWLENALKD